MFKYSWNINNESKNIVNLKQKIEFSRIFPPFLKLYIVFLTIAFYITKQNLDDIFVEEVLSKPTEKNYDTKKTMIERNYNTWSSDSSDIIDYGTKYNTGYKHTPVVHDCFSKNVFGVPLKNRAPQTKAIDFSNFIQNND